jgi:hypothetical protein
VKSDCNELHAWVRATQNLPGLQQLSALCQEQIDMLQTPNVQGFQPSRYVHEQQHTKGGAGQAVMTGPSPAGIRGTSTAEQAAINMAIKTQQADQNRVPQQAVAVIDPAGFAQGNPAAEEAAREAYEGGRDPLAAVAAARKGEGGSAGMVAAPATMQSANATQGAIAEAGGEEKGETGQRHEGKTVPSGKQGPDEGRHQEGTDKAANTGRPAKK